MSNNEGQAESGLSFVWHGGLLNQVLLNRIWVYSNRMKGMKDANTIEKKHVNVFNIGI